MSGSGKSCVRNREDYSTESVGSDASSGVGNGTGRFGHWCRGFKLDIEDRRCCYMAIWRARTPVARNYMPRVGEVGYTYSNF